jgi:enamine deaminase RidA (YjgF/YER057c/UK114 family)
MTLRKKCRPARKPGQHLTDRQNAMIHSQKMSSIGFLTIFALCAFAGSAMAGDVVHNQESARAPFASSTMVPPGYDTYYISGSSGKGGDTATQTSAALDGLKAQMAKLGLTFGDIVQAHVFLAGDPNMNGKMDFAGMNSAWFKDFGTPEQPNKPARAAFQVAALAGQSDLVEIEFIAVKRAP